MDSPLQSEYQEPNVSPLFEIALLLYISAMMLLTGGSILSAFLRVEAIAPTHILASFVYPIPMVGFVLLLVAITRPFSTQINKQTFSKIYLNLFLLAFCAGMVEGFSSAAGDPLGLIGKLVIFVLIGVLVFKASQQSWMPKLASLIPGFLLGLLVVWGSDAIINLLIYDVASNPTRFLLFAIMNFGAIGVSIAIAAAFEEQKKYGIWIGLLSLLSALILMYVNRVYLFSVPKFYAHLSLAFFEWMAVFGFLNWARFRFEKSKYVYYFVVVLIIGGATSLCFLERNPEAPIPRRLDPSAGLFATPWEVFDFDSDGFLATYLGGLDCEEWNPDIHPLAQDTPGKDLNCNGFIGELVEVRKFETAKKTADLVLLITIDQLRPDRMSIYGYSNITTPQLDKHAHDFVRFDKAYAPGGITTISLPSFNSGTYIMASKMNPVFRTTRHRYVDTAASLEDGEFLDTPFLSPSKGSVRWVAEDFREGGARTAAVVDDHRQRLPSTVFGMNGVFDSLENVKYSGGSSADRLTESAINELKDETLGYLWLHYYDPHSSPRKCKMFEITGNIGCYDESIFDTDRQLGKLFAAMKRAGKWDATYIAISSDHGEAFGEHRFQYHGLNSHEESVKVPLLVKYPKDSEHAKQNGSVVAHNVSALDAIASGLVAAGLPPYGHGHPLENKSAREFPILSYRVILDPFGRPFEQNILLVDGDLRVFYDTVRGVTRVFSLDKDPNQEHPYFDEKAQQKIFEAIDKVGANGSGRPR